MSNRRYLLATCLILPCVAGAIWMLTPALPPTPAESAPATADAPAQTDGSQAESPRKEGGASHTGRRSPRDLAVLSRPAAPVRESASTYAPRPVVMAGRQLPAEPSGSGTVEPQIRMASPSAAAAAGVNTPRDPSAPATAGAAPGELVLEVGPGLHDPIAWTTSAATTGGAKGALQQRIGEQFSAEVAAAVTNPEGAGQGGVDQAWRDAKARADWEYRKFFGDAAANRAGVATGREAVAGP